MAAPGSQMQTGMLNTGEKLYFVPGNRCLSWFCTYLHRYFDKQVSPWSVVKGGYLRPVDKELFRVVNNPDEGFLATWWKEDK